MADDYEPDYEPDLEPALDLRPSAARRRARALGDMPIRLKGEPTDAYLLRLRIWRERVEAHNRMILLRGQSPRPVTAVGDPRRHDILEAILVDLRKPPEG